MVTLRSSTVHHALVAMSILLSAASGQGVAETDEAPVVLRGHTDEIVGVRFAPGDKNLISVAESGELLLWNLETGERIAALGLQCGIARCLDVGPGGLVAVGGAAGMTLLRAEEDNLQELQFIEQPAQKLAFSLDGALLVAVDNNRDEQHVFQVEAHGLTLAGSTTVKELVGVAMDSEGIVVSAEKGGSIRFFDVVSGQYLPDRSFQTGRTLARNLGKGRTSITRREKLVQAAFAEGGHLCILGDQAKSVEIWNLHTGQRSALLKGLDAPAYRFAWSDATDLVAIVAQRRLSFSFSWPKTKTGLDYTNGRAIQLCDAATGKTWTTLKGHTGRVQCLDFCDARGLLASGGGDETVRLWDIARWQRPVSTQ